MLKTQWSIRVNMLPTITTRLLGTGKNIIPSLLCRLANRTLVPKPINKLSPPFSVITTPRSWGPIIDLTI